MRFELTPYNGGGLNLWCIASARRCRNANLSTHEAETRIMAFQGTAHRPIKLNEVRRAISRAYETELAPSNAPKPKKEQCERFNRLPVHRAMLHDQEKRTHPGRQRKRALPR